MRHLISDVVLAQLRSGRPVSPTGQAGHWQVGMTRIKRNDSDQQRLVGCGLYVEQRPW